MVSLLCIAPLCHRHIQKNVYVICSTTESTKGPAHKDFMLFFWSTTDCQVNTVHHLLQTWPLSGHISLRVLSCNTPDCAASTFSPLESWGSFNESLYWAGQNCVLVLKLQKCICVSACTPACVSVVPLSQPLKTQSCCLLLHCTTKRQRPREVKVESVAICEYVSVKHLLYVWLNICVHKCSFSKTVGVKRTVPTCSQAEKKVFPIGVKRLCISGHKKKPNINLRIR